MKYKSLLIFFIILNLFKLIISQVEIINKELLDQSYPDVYNECIIRLKLEVGYPENSLATYYSINKTQDTEIKWKDALLDKVNKTSTTIKFIISIPISNPSFDLVISGPGIAETTFTDILNGIFICKELPNNIKINSIVKLPKYQYSNNDSLNSTLLNIKEIKHWSNLKLNVLDVIPVDIKMIQISSELFRISYSALKPPLEFYDTSKSIIDCQLVDQSNSSNIIDLKIDISNLFKPDSIQLTTNIKSVQSFSSPENHFLLNNSSSSNGNIIGSLTQQLLVSNINSFISLTFSNESDSKLKYQLNNNFKPVYGSGSDGNQLNDDSISIFISRVSLYESKKYGYLLYDGSESKVIDTFISNQNYSNLIQYYNSSIIKFTNGKGLTETYSRYKEDIEFTLFNQNFKYENVLPSYFQYITSTSNTNSFYIQYSMAINILSRDYKLSDFPINFINGSLSDFNYNIIIFGSKYKGNQISIINSFNGEQDLVILTPSSTIVYNDDSSDSGSGIINDIGPYVLDFQKIPVTTSNMMLMILRLQIKSKIGLGIIKINNIKYSAPSVLVEGDLKLGYYEIHYDYTVNPNPEIYLIDNSLNSIQLQYYYGYDEVYPIPPNPTSVTYTILDISHFKFSTNTIDLSSKGSNVTLYLNFTTGSDPNYTPILYLDINDNSLSNNGVIGNWDSSIQLYRIDFTLPARLYSGNLYYILNITNVYNTEELASIIGDDAYVSIKSTYADQMPPILKEIQQINNNTHFGWLLTIEELVNGFKSGFIKVTGDYDYLGYRFNFTNKDLNSNGQFNLIIKKEFYSSGGDLYCRNQNYTISTIRLEDQSGFYSFTSMSSQLNYNIDPLMYIQDHSKLTIKMNCIDPQDSQLPQLSSSDIIISDNFSPFTNDRNIIFKFTCYDENGISNRNHPIVQLLNVYNEKLLCNNVILEYSNNTHSHFNCSITTPYGYGYPTGIQLLLFGIMDNNFNFNSILDFGFINTTSSLNNNINIPVIISNQNYYYGSKDLILFGKHFGSNSIGDSISLNLYNNNNKLNNGSIKIKYISSTTLIIENIPNSISTLSKFIIQLNVNNKLSNNYTIKSTYNNNKQDQDEENNSSSSNSNSNNNSCNIGNNNLECSGNGDCINNICICHDQYFGDSCQSKIVIIKPPKINTTNPESVIEYDGNDILEQSIITIIGMNEISITGEPIKMHRFDKWIYNNITDQIGRLSSLYTTYIYYNNINTTINVKVEWFNQSSDYSFAGLTFKMLPSSVKYTISMNTYGFLNQLNSLQLLMYTNIKANNNKICKVNQSFTNSTSNNEYNDNDISQYLQLQINEYNLIARFIKRGQVDGLITSISNTYYSSNGSLSSTIAIGIPNYKYNVIVDPDFSTLITSNSNICSDDSLTTNQLIGIIIGGTGFVLVLAFIFGFLLYKKLKYNSKFLSLKDKLKFNNNNNNNKNIDLKEL